MKPLTSKYRISGFGVCHRKPERSFFYKGQQFPMCARCTGIAIGFSTLPIFLIGQFHLGLWISIAMILPTYLDGWIQLLWDVESTNWRRVTTGFVAGIGMMSLAALIGQEIAEFIVNQFN